MVPTPGTTPAVANDTDGTAITPVPPVRPVCGEAYLVHIHPPTPEAAGRYPLGAKPVVIGRQHDGKVFALRDICPHRGIPLHYGHFDGETIACSYHGWRFDESGACVEQPYEDTANPKP